MSCSMASMARRLMSSGAEKSGKPCERFTAPCFSASRVISRITDSVNELALRDTWRCFEVDGLVMTTANVNTKPQKGTQRIDPFCAFLRLRDDLLARRFTL